ncbi:MAG TPA: tRNA-dihydrouridine synthase [Anaerolineales bacterium]|nr:tRNA-dihydrouridine synthase [Anaerolineales bacterium]
MNAPIPNFFVREIPIYGTRILAPMDGFSDLPFRSMCYHLGSAMSYTEFVNVDELQGKKGGNPHTRQKLRYDPSERPITFQIYGHQLDRVVETALRLQELQPDIIDVNMGCYVKSISERGAGAGMLRFPERIAYLFGRLSKELEVPVTGKIRLGWDVNSKNYKIVAKILEDNGASLIAVHARTRDQGYTGTANWDAIAEVKQLVRVPVIGNGDVQTNADVARIMAHTACDAVMIGRGAIGNPWIFAGKDRAEVTLAEKIALMRKHLALNIEFYGEQAGLRQFRKHANQYARAAMIDGQNVEPSLRIPLLTANSIQEFLAILNEHEAQMRVASQ